MSARRLLTVFGATGNQGGSIIDVVLASRDLQQKYSLRGITRDPSSDKSQALSKKGVEMVKAELDDLESLRAAVRGSYGVFGVTDFWSILDKQREIQQGKNIFEAAKAEGVTHLVFSSLPYAEKISQGTLKNVAHFDSKAQVEEYIEANKGSLWASYVLPAMFINFAKTSVKPINGTPTLNMPFPSDSIAWPLVDPRRDTGKYAMGLFEGEKSADGARAHAVSMWTTPKEVVAALSKESGKEVLFKIVPADVFAGFMPEKVSKELTETMLMVGDHSYYGQGEKSNQKDHDKWLVKGTSTIGLEQWVKENGPWKFE